MDPEGAGRSEGGGGGRMGEARANASGGNCKAATSTMLPGCSIQSDASPRPTKESVEIGGGHTQITSHLEKGC